MVCNNDLTEKELGEVVKDFAAAISLSALVKVVQQKAMEPFISQADSKLVGDIGEETAAAFVQNMAGTAIIALGDSHLKRPSHRSDLDMVAAVDDVLCVFEVKTRRSGTTMTDRDLAKPRLNPARVRADGEPTHPQGSDKYNAQRLGNIIDTTEPFPGVETRVIKVDLSRMQLQQFEVDEHGKVGKPIGGPVWCVEEVSMALERLRSGRGELR